MQKRIKTIDYILIGIYTFKHNLIRIITIDFSTTKVKRWKKLANTISASIFRFLTNIMALRRIYRKIVPAETQDWVLRVLGGEKYSPVKLGKVLVDYLNAKPKKQEIDLKAICFLKKHKRGFVYPEFLTLFLQKLPSKERVYNFNGAIIPAGNNSYEFLSNLIDVFNDSFLFSIFLDDNYKKEVIQQFEPYMPEGPYGYIDEKFDVSIKTGDVVIDGGAWIGDFSAYAASKGAVCYAFEPVIESYNSLVKTAELNSNKIHPVKKGLGEKDAEVPMLISTTGSTIYGINHAKDITETIQITSLDKFVEENNLPKVDFIKADIEGSERDMLKGAKRVLKEFAPKLAICTYHFPDDPQVLKDLILEANPNYTIVQLRKKLYACVVR